MLLRLVSPPRWLEPGIQDPDEPRITRHRSYAIGDCWYATRDPAGDWYMWPEAAEGAEHGDAPLRIAPEHAGVRPMIVVLPECGGLPWCLHGTTIKDGVPGRSGWKVSGSLPRVTVSPSINFDSESRREGGRPGWHGHIRDGRIEP